MTEPTVSFFSLREKPSLVFLNVFFRRRLAILKYRDKVSKMVETLIRLAEKPAVTGRFATVNTDSVFFFGVQR